MGWWERRARWSNRCVTRCISGRSDGHWHSVAGTSGMGSSPFSAILDNYASRRSCGIWQRMDGVSIADTVWCTVHRRYMLQQDRCRGGGHMW